jgi:hypothetical protein
VTNESRRLSMGELGAPGRQRHRTVEEWRTLVAAWRANGKSSFAWCEEQGISRESLRRWKKRLGRSTAEPSLVQIPRMPFSPGVRVKLTREGELEFSGAITEEFIRLLLGVMREPERVR